MAIALDQYIQGQMSRVAYRGKGFRRLKMDPEPSTPVYPRVPLPPGIFPPGVRPFVGVKRRRSGTARRVKRHREATGGGASRQLTYEKRQYGRRPKQNLDQAFKLLRTYTDSYVLKFSKINDMKSAETTYGALTLANRKYTWEEDGIGGIDYRYPVHLYDITSCLNSTGSGTSVIGQPGYELCRIVDPVSGNAGGFEFRRIQGRDPGGNSTFAWSKVVTTDQNASSVPEARSILQWMDLKMVLYGTRKCPTKYIIQLVQFDEEDDDPLKSVSFQSEPAPVDAKDNDEALYTYLTKPLLYNPISDSSITSRKRFKVLQSWTHAFNPDSSDNLDVAPAQKVFKVFKRFNRNCKWDWNPRQVIDTSDVANEMLDKYDVNLNQNDCVLAPKARIYLMIRAMNLNRQLPYTGGTTYNVPANSDFDPTYDINLKVKHIFQH